MKQKKKILIGVPHSYGIDARFVVSLCQTSIALTCNNFICEIFFKEGSLVPKQRNDIARAMLKEKFDYLLFVDTDMTFSFDDVQKLIDADKDIIGGLCYTRRAPFFPVVYKFAPNNSGYFVRWPDVEKYTEAFECDGVGSAFILIKRDVIDIMFMYGEELGWPFSLWQLENGDQLGEDLSFCIRANKLGMKVWCEPNVCVSHIGDVMINKNTVISSLNVRSSSES